MFSVVSVSLTGLGKSFPALSDLENSAKRIHGEFGM